MYLFLKSHNVTKSIKQNNSKASDVNTVSKKTDKPNKSEESSKVEENNPQDIDANIVSPKNNEQDKSKEYFKGEEDISTSEPVKLPPAATEKNDNEPLDIIKISNFINNSYGGKLNDSLKEYLDKKIDDYETKNIKISSFDIADVNNDGDNELVLAYCYPYDKSKEPYENYFHGTTPQKGVLGVYKFKTGNLTELDKTDIFYYSSITITNLIPAYKNSIFVMGDEGEYPSYEMYIMKGNKLSKVDLESVGIKNNAQFISIDNYSIYIGYRITGGVYGGDTYSWKDGKLETEEHHVSDNRYLYKTQEGDISYLYDYDKTIPEIKNGKVTVSNAYQLMSVIGPDRTIYLKPGIYDLGFAQEVNNNYLNIGEEFTIKNVENMKIIGLDKDKTEIALVKASFKVLSIINSNNIQLKNVMMGHGTEFEECSSEVLYIENSNDISIEDCCFYGSGAYGIVTNKVNKMKVVNSIIEECSWGGVVLKESKEITFNNIKFYKNSGDVLIEAKNCENILFDSVEDNENDTKTFENNENSTLEIKNVNKIP